jgi:hypothetical protein
MRRGFGIGVGVAGLVLAIGAVVAIAQEGGGEAMDKPLAKFTIGDLFPKVSAGLRETAASWKEAAGAAKEMTSTRMQNIDAAIPKVKAALAQAKTDAKTADKAKDFTAAGTAEGKMRTQEVVMDVLDRLKAVSSAQNGVASAWEKAADAMQKFADADDAFDQYRANGIERPEAGAQDTRLDQAGFQAFKQHAQALADLGKAFEALGSQTGTLAAGRLKFATDLEKGGHIQPPPAK